MSPLTYSISLNFLKTRIREVVTKIPKPCIRKLKTWPQVKTARGFHTKCFFKLFSNAPQLNSLLTGAAFCFSRIQEPSLRWFRFPADMSGTFCYSTLLFCFTGTFAAAH